MGKIKSNCKNKKTWKKMKKYPLFLQNKMIDEGRLAINGGKAIRQKPFPERFLFDYREKNCK